MEFGSRHVNHELLLRILRRGGSDCNGNIYGNLALVESFSVMLRQMPFDVALP